MCCKDTSVIERVSGGASQYIQATDIATTLNDDIVDEDISIIQAYFSKDAWALLEQKGDGILNT